VEDEEDRKLGAWEELEELEEYPALWGDESVDGRWESLSGTPREEEDLCEFPDPEEASPPELLSWVPSGP